MGNQASMNDPTKKAELIARSGFSEEDLKRLYQRFQKIDANQDGMLSKEEFLAVGELNQNPLINRVIDIFDQDRNGSIDFNEFITGLSIFADESHNEDKVKFAFKVYDVNNDGFISNGDLYRILKIMVGDNLDDTQLQQLVDRTIYQADKDKDGKLNYEEFYEMISDSGVEDKLKIDFSMDSD